MNPARFFTWATLAFGCVVILLTPPFSMPDEPAHLYRAWSIAGGRWHTSRGDAVPRSIVQAAAAMLKLTRGAETRPVTFDQLRSIARIPLNAASQQFVTVPPDPSQAPLAYTAPSYTPAGYAATAAAIALGRLLQLSPVALVYLGRCANLAAATLLIAWSIAAIPFGRWTLALVALTPMAVFMRASLSVDSLLFAAAIALTAALLAAKPAPVIVLTFVLGAVKPGYILIALLALAVPRLRSRPAVLAAILLSAIASSLLNLSYVRDANAAASPSVASRGREVATHPLAYTRELSRELTQDAKLLMVEAVADFGWLDAPAPPAFAALWCAALVAMALIDGRSMMTPSLRVASAALFVMEVVAVVTLIHIATPPPDFVRGLQGRYFLPVVPLGILPLTVTAVDDTLRYRFAAFLTAIAFVQTAWILLTRYWL